MEQKICLLICSSFIDEVKQIINSGYYPDVIIKSFQSSCADQYYQLENIDDIVRLHASEYSKVVLIGGPCLISKKDNYKRSHNIQIIVLDHCSELFLNKSTIDYLTSKKNYIVSNGWLRDYKKHVKNWGYDTKASKKYISENVDKLLLLETELPDDYLIQIKALSNHMGLPYDILPVGLSYCKLFLDSIILHWREEKERVLLNTKLSIVSGKSADYLFVLSQIDNLVTHVDEKNVVEKIFNLLNMLYAPINIKYIPAKDNNENNPIFYKKNVLIPAEYIDSSFTIDLSNQEENIGIFEITGVSFPQYIEKYKEMSLLIGRVSGLAISNARKFMIIKEDEKRIKKYSAELKEVVTTRDKFFSIIAHDLKSPFQGLLGMSEILAESADSFTKEEISVFSREMFNTANNLFKLLQDLLTWAQMQKGTIEYAPKELNLYVLAVQNIDIISQRAIQKGINIRNEIPFDQLLYGDEKMLDTVLRNLLSNAVKFTKRDGNITISAKEIEGKFLEIAVKDSGIGMSEVLCEKLFKIEEKVGRAGTDGEASTGLGLLLCKEFIEKNGGKIWVKSEINIGSTLIFTFPIYAITN